MNASNYSANPDPRRCAIGRCTCKTNGRPVDFHVSAHNANGWTLPERVWSDMDMYADVKTADEARKIAAGWFADDDRVSYASIRESHQPTEGLPWVVGPFVEQIDRPDECETQASDAEQDAS
jgi:hypothetical protein